MSIVKYLIVPGVMAGTYLAVKGNKKLGTPEKVGIVAGAGLLTFLVQRTVTSFGGMNVQKAPVDYGQIPTVFDSAGKPVKWDPDPIAKEIFENMEGYNLYTYPETTNKILSLQPDQIKLLYNHYNQYYADEFPTLTKLIESEWPDWEGSYSKAVARLKSLGLN